MSFVESSVPTTFNSGTNVTLVAGVAGSRKIVKNIIICNLDTVDAIVTCEFVRSATAYRLFKITLAAGDTLIQDVPVVLSDNNDLIRARLNGAITTSQPQAVATLATIT